MIATVASGPLLTDAAMRLAAVGIESPRHEARLLLALALGRSAHALVSESEIALTPDAVARFASFLERRLNREPYSRIAGKREFWSLELGLAPETLDPRPDSETLIEAALGLLPDRAVALRIVDFGTGTGALLLALLSEYPNARGIGVDILPGAVAQAAVNAAAHGLQDRARFVCGDWSAELEGPTDLPADLIVANPPYIRSGDVAMLPREVRGSDPETALDGGPDGLEAYRQLARPVSSLFKQGGLALLEIGAGQAPEVEAILSQAGFEIMSRRADLSGVLRCLAFGRRRNFGKSFK